MEEDDVYSMMMIPIAEAARRAGYRDASSLRRAANYNLPRGLEHMVLSDRRVYTTMAWVEEWEANKRRGGYQKGRGRSWPEDHINRELLRKGEQCECSRCRGIPAKKRVWGERSPRTYQHKEATITTSDTAETTGGQGPSTDHRSPRQTGRNVPEAHGL